MWITKPMLRGKKMAVMALVPIVLMPTSAGAVSATPAIGRFLDLGLTRHATAARRMSLIANATLRVTKNQGSTINAQGFVSGTISGSLSLHTIVNSASRMTSSFVGSSRSGTLTGTSVSDYGVSGNTIYYTGTARITHGTGVYAHVHAAGIHVEGTMNRRQKIVRMRINGNMSV